MLCSKEPRRRIGEETIRLEELLHLLLSEPAITDELVLDRLHNHHLGAPWQPVGTKNEGSW